MTRCLINTALSKAGETVRISGWVHTIRNQKRMIFLILRDHTGVLQCILQKGSDSVLESKLTDLSHESAVTVTGLLIASGEIRLGGVELQIQDINVLSNANSPIVYDVFGPAQPSLDLRMDWRFLDLRRPENLLVFEVQTTAEMAMREFWIREGFLEMHSPKLMGSPSESGAELFKLDYFDKVAYLAQSPQFYKQMAMAAGFDRVFEIGPVFRANPSFTSRHDTEFTSVDVEMSWIDSHEDVMEFEERWICYVLERIRATHGDKIAALRGRDVTIPTLPFPRITLEDALRAIQSERTDPSHDPNDLDSHGEKLLSEYIRRETGHEFVFVTDYPAEIRAFYHMRQDEDTSKTKSFDLLWNGLEVTTGAQREHRYDVLLRQTIEKGLNPELLGFYLDFFKYGCPPHGGFGFGLTRMLMLLLGFSNVREVTFIYRGPTRLHP